MLDGLPARELPGLVGADDLASALGLSISRLRWLAYHRDVDTGTHDRRWTIPTRDGSARTIASPKRELKRAQRWALRNLFDKRPVHGAAHGFLTNRSIVTNAAAHAGADTLVKVDSSCRPPAGRAAARNAPIMRGVLMSTSHHPRDRAHVIAQSLQRLQRGTRAVLAASNRNECSNDAVVQGEGDRGSRPLFDLDIERDAVRLLDGVTVATTTASTTLTRPAPKGKEANG